jgi:hypothetical protein
VKATYRADFDDSPTLGELLDALTRMRDHGAPNDATVALALGDKGTQRDPWPYLRGLSVTWEADDA